MIMADWVQTLLDDLRDLLSGDLKNLCDHSKNSDIFKRLESRDSLTKLINFLVKNSADLTPLTYLKLKPLCDLLGDRWLKNNKTDAAYPHDPYSVVNIAYVIVARRLAEELNEKYYTFLMPSVAANLFQTSKGCLEAFKLHEFVLSDDGIPIEIAACLELAVKMKTTELKNPNQNRIPLSFAETQRVIYHSTLTEDYYDAIKYYVESGITNDVIAAREALLNAFESDEYQVSSSYGKLGRKKLASGVVASMQTLSELIQVMEVDLMPEDWKDFLSLIPTREIQRLLIGTDKWKNILQQKSLYTKNRLHNNAILFCFIEIYLRTDLEGDKLQTARSWLTYHTQKYVSVDFNLGGFDQYAKKATALELQTFLTQGYTKQDFIRYFSAPDKAHYKAPLFQCMSGLNLIYSQFEALNDPFFFDIKAPGFWNLLG